MIGTERLFLRRWREVDVAPYWAMGRDPLVMRTIGPMLTREEAEATATRQNALIDTLGHGFWAVERRDGAFLGFCGIGIMPAGTPATGELEIGWRLASAHWRRGYAREAAEAALAWTWAHTDARRVVAITTPGNTASWGLMIRLGMTRVAGGDFDHPALAPGDPLRRHLTYVIDRPA